MARRFWPGESPLGQRVALALSQETVEVVGVVGDVKPFRPDQLPRPQLYWPFAQAPRWAVMLIARTELEPGDFRSELEARMEELEPDLDISRTRTMDELVADQLVNPAFNAGLADLFGGIALLISLIGVYGVMSLSVQQRFPEFGVRIALGARNWDLRREVLGNALLLTGAGLAAGLLASWLLTRLLRNLLIDVAPTDPLTYAVISLGVILTASLASYFPARRASRVDPLEVIRATSRIHLHRGGAEAAQANRPRPGRQDVHQNRTDPESLSRSGKAASFSRYTAPFTRRTSPGACPQCRYRISSNFRPAHAARDLILIPFSFSYQQTLYEFFRGVGDSAGR